MRYSVRLAGLLRCSKELEQAVRKQRQDVDALEGAIRRLSQLGGMNSVTAQLRGELRTMEDQVQTTLSMAQAARRIHQVYTDTENTILGELDCPFQATAAQSGSISFSEAAASSAVDVVSTAVIRSPIQEVSYAVYSSLLKATGIIIKLAV